MPPPTFDEYLRFYKCVELLTGQQLIAEPTVERLDVTVLPWTARFDEQCLHADPGKPLTHLLGRELRAVIGADILPC